MKMNLRKILVVFLAVFSLLSILPGQASAGWFSDACDWVSNKVQAAVQWIVDAAKSLVDWVQGLINEIQGKLDNAGNMLRNDLNSFKSITNAKFNEAKSKMEAEKRRMDAKYAEAAKAKAQDDRHKEIWAAIEAANNKVAWLYVDTVTTQADMLKNNLANTTTNVESTISSLTTQVNAGLLNPLRDSLSILNNLIRNPFSIDSLDPITPIVEGVNLAYIGSEAVTKTFIDSMDFGAKQIQDAMNNLTLPEQGTIRIAFTNVAWAQNIIQMTDTLKNDPTNKKKLIGLNTAIRTRPKAVAIPSLTQTATALDRRRLNPDDIRIRATDVKSRANQFRIEANKPLASGQKSDAFENLLKGKSAEDIEKARKEVRQEMVKRYGKSPWVMAKVDKIIDEQIAQATGPKPQPLPPGAGAPEPVKMIPKRIIVPRTQ